MAGQPAPDRPWWQLTTRPWTGFLIGGAATLLGLLLFALAAASPAWYLLAPAGFSLVVGPGFLASALAQNRRERERRSTPLPSREGNRPPEPRRADDRTRGSDRPSVSDRRDRVGDAADGPPARPDPLRAPNPLRPPEPPRPPEPLRPPESARAPRPLGAQPDPQASRPDPADEIGADPTRTIRPAGPRPGAAPTPVPGAAPGGAVRGAPRDGAPPASGPRSGRHAGAGGEPVRAVAPAATTRPTPEPAARTEPVARRGGLWGGSTPAVVPPPPPTAAPPSVATVGGRHAHQLPGEQGRHRRDGIGSGPAAAPLPAGRGTNGGPAVTAPPALTGGPVVAATNGHLPALAPNGDGSRSGHAARAVDGGPPGYIGEPGRHRNGHPPSGNGHPPSSNGHGPAVSPVDFEAWGFRLPADPSQWFDAGIAGLVVTPPHGTAIVDGARAPGARHATTNGTVPTTTAPGAERHDGGRHRSPCAGDASRPAGGRHAVAAGGPGTGPPPVTGPSRRRHARREGDGSPAVDAPLTGGPAVDAGEAADTVPLLLVGRHRPAPGAAGPERAPDTGRHRRH